MPTEEPLDGGGSTAVHRAGDVVLRTARPWTPTILALLRHLEGEGYAGSPRVAGTGLAADGREALRYVPGDVGPVPWRDDGAYALGALLAGLHRATATFPLAGRTWLPWWGRDAGGPVRVVGHCDAAPWNVVARDGVPVALLDWDTAGPVDPLWDLAQAAWLNAQLYDDHVPDLPDAATRCRLVRLVCDGYGLDAGRRATLPDVMVEIAVRTAAQEAIDAGVHRGGFDPAPTGRLGGGPPLVGHDVLWAMTWRTRGAAWMLRHRDLLDAALR